MLSGRLYVISAPSGAGKTSLIKALVESVSHMKVSVSHTTRDIRQGEKNGINYHYINKTSFLELVKQNIFMEYAEVFGNYYGTSKNWVNEQLKTGTDIILEIDWQGAQQIRAAMPETISIFILPPSINILKQRLIGRRQDNSKTIDYRMSKAISEISHYNEFNYTIINDEFDLALRDLQTIIRSRRLTTSCVESYKKNIIKNLLSNNKYL